MLVYGKYECSILQPDVATPMRFPVVRAGNGMDGNNNDILHLARIQGSEATMSLPWRSI